MKKTTFSILIVLILSLSVTSNVFGMAAHCSGSPDDQWYTVTPEKPCRQISFYRHPDVNQVGIFGEVFQNAQTFFNVSYGHSYEHSYFNFSDIIDKESSNIDLNASYLFNSGLFFGISYYQNCYSVEVNQDGFWKNVLKYHYTSTYYTPGYRYNFNEHSYAALSMDILDDDQTTKTVSYEFLLKHYTSNLYYSSRVYHYLSSDQSSNTYIDNLLNYQFSNQFVGGIDTTLNKSLQLDNCSAGFTWTTQPFIVNFETIHYGSGANSQFFYSFYQISPNFGFGLQLLKYPHNPNPDCNFTLSAQLPQGKLRFYYSPKQDHQMKHYSLVYYQQH